MEPTPPSRPQKLSVELRVQIYRAGTGAIILNDDNHVLVFQRSDHKGWQFPQGGLDRGEADLEGVIREIREETGLTEADVEQLPIPTKNTAYVIPPGPRHETKNEIFRGQAHTWFFFRFVGSEDAITLGDGLEFSAWKWTTLEEAIEHVTPFKQDVYRDIARHLADHM